MYNMLSLPNEVHTNNKQIQQEFILIHVLRVGLLQLTIVLVYLFFKFLSTILMIYESVKIK